MPLYIDIHELDGVTADAVARAHAADLEKQGQYGVNYIKYWVNEGCGKVFCLVDAPSPDAAVRVHREAHGMEPGRMIRIEPELVDGFIGGGVVNLAGAVLAPGGEALDTGTRTIFFTDIVDSTSLINRLGDAAGIRLVEAHNGVVRSALTACQGREVKHTGDGIMASFLDAAAAVRCALRVQREVARLDMGDTPLRVRIGAAAGEPVERQGDFFGSTVNLAARLCSHAAPAQVLVSATVVQDCRDGSLRFEDLGEVALKGFERPVRAHAALA